MDEIKAAAERVIHSVEAYIADHGNPRVAPNLYTDSFTVARYVLRGQQPLTLPAATSVPWDDLRLDQVEEGAQACTSGDACTVDVLSLVAEVRRLRDAQAARVAALEAEVERLRRASAIADGVEDNLVDANNRLRAALEALLRHCKAHEHSARLLGQTAWWVATAPDPIEQAFAALAPPQEAIRCRTCDACGNDILGDYVETLVEGDTGEYHVECVPPKMPRRLVLAAPLAGPEGAEAGDSAPGGE